MRNRVGVILGLALVSGLLAAYLALRFLRQSNTASPTQTVETQGVTVLVAARDLEGGYLLQLGDVRAIQWPAGNVPEGYARDPQEVVGRGLLAEIRKDEPILASKVASPGAGYGLQLIVAPGMRGQAIRITEEIGVAGWLHAGMRVDVLATLDQGAQIEETTTQTILQDIRILRIGQQQAVDDQNQAMVVTVVTLETDPDEAQKLALVATKAQIRLILRNQLDRDTLDLRSIRARELITGRRVVNTGVRRATPPPARRSIEIIRGTEKEVIEANGNGGSGGGR